MQLFERPAILDETRPQIIQKLRMRRWLRARSEVVRRADNSLPEMVQPYAIDDHARGERVIRADDLLRQFQPAAAVLEGLPRLFLLSRERHEFQKLPRHHRSFVPG